ncbi:MAG TPA: HNH endonuclease signature motif containing protein [Acidimicrobiales bacterium]|nr:HNH endonuclease signature motif containing protein [Acidimicrobiales bacterium]
MKDDDLRDQLDAAAPAVQAASGAFRTAAQSATLASYPAAANVGGLTKKELTWVYDVRFAKAKSPGRLVYNEIKSSAVNGRCPMCGHRQVSTLDHYLPKASFPALSVTPDNLVPACGDCNKQKLDVVPAHDGEVMLHPYFDDVESQPWLVAQVLQTAPASIEFSVDAPAAWSVVLSARVAHHFESLQLSTLYAAQAADELINIRHSLADVHAAGGPTEVASFLKQAADSRRAARVNSWQTAMYSAIANSPWFCEGGFA